REHLDALEKVPFPRVVNQGLTGAIFPIAKSIAAIQSGNLSAAQQHLHDTDQSLINVKLLNCFIDLASGRVLKANQRAYQLGSEIHGFRQFQIARLSIISYAHLLLDELDECLLALQLAADLPEGITVKETSFFTPEV